MKMLTQISILITTFVFLGLTACSSHAKKEDTKPTSPTTTATTTPSASANPSADKKSSAKKKKSKGTETKTASAKSGTAASVTCKSGEEVRTLEVKDAGEGCELVYTKQNEAKTVASSTHGKEYCETKSDKIKSKLEASGYTCE
jgi:hypothetical protein